jgi:hypothetical protein
VTASRHVGITDPTARRAWLQRFLAEPVSLVWTDNRASMISVKRRAASGYELRLHHMFRQAPDTIWQALVDYIHGADANASQTLRVYIKQQQHLIRGDATPSVTQALRTQGHYFDLKMIYGDLNQSYFAGGVEAEITWMRRPLKRPRTSIRFGSYDARQRLIRIHPLLDQAFVPLYVVENIVFHEMLHQLIPHQRVKGRWSIHPPAFRRAEQQFRHYHQAERWLKTHLHRLLCDAVL